MTKPGFVNKREALQKDFAIKTAEAMGFHLDYDKWNNLDKSKYSNGDWLRFCLPKELDEPDLRWIWWKTLPDESNIEEGIRIEARGKRKKEIQEFLKY